MIVTDGFKMGYIIWSNKLIINPNFYSLNGQNLVRNGNRVNYIDYIANIPKIEEYFITEQDYFNSINKFGTCLKYVWYENNKMLKLPTFTIPTQIDIKTKLENYSDRLNRYTICYCFPSITEWNTNYCNTPQQKPTEITKKENFFYKRTNGYMYIVVNNLDIEFNTDVNIPNAILVRNWK